MWRKRRDCISDYWYHQNPCLLTRLLAIQSPYSLSQAQWQTPITSPCFPYPVITLITLFWNVPQKKRLYFWLLLPPESVFFDTTIGSPIPILAIVTVITDNNNITMPSLRLYHSLSWWHPLPLPLISHFLTFVSSVSWVYRNASNRNGSNMLGVF